MENPKRTLKHYRNNIKFFKIKLALQTPQQNFSQLMLLEIAQVMMVDLKIISKLPGINQDRSDWYLVEAFGTFENISLTIACWQDLGVQKYLAIPTR